MAMPGEIFVGNSNCVEDKHFETTTKLRNAVDEHVGNKLSIRMKQLNITTQYLAFAINVSAQRMQEFETGRARLGAMLLKELCDLLCCGPDYFFDP